MAQAMVTDLWSRWLYKTPTIFYYFYILAHYYITWELWKSLNLHKWSVYSCDLKKNCHTKIFIVKNIFVTNLEMKNTTNSIQLNFNSFTELMNKFLCHYSLYMNIIFQFCGLHSIVSCKAFVILNWYTLLTYF